MKLFEVHAVVESLQSLTSRFPVVFCCYFSFYFFPKHFTANVEKIGEGWESCESSSVVDMTYISRAHDTLHGALSEAQQLHDSR